MPGPRLAAQPGGAGPTRWPRTPPGRARLAVPLPVSLLLHGGALAAALLWVGRPLPPAPVATSVEMVWEDSPGEQVTAEAEAPAAPAAPPAPEAPSEAPPPPPPPAPPAPRFAEAPPAAPRPAPPAAAAPAPAPPIPAPPPPSALPQPPMADAPRAGDLAPPPPPLAPPVEAPRAEAAAMAPPLPPPVETPPEPSAALAEAIPAAEPLPLPLPPPPAPPAPPQRAAARPAPLPPGPAAPPAEAAPGAAAGIGRAAGAVVPPGPDPAFRNAGPPYPEGARLRGETGTVGLELAIGADGRVLNVAVTRPSGSAALDEAARRAALAWRFRPATLDGQPVPGTIRTSVHFRLS